MSNTCTLCTKPLPIRALHFSNRLAIEHGYCSWICLSTDLGHEGVLALLNAEAVQANRKEN